MLRSAELGKELLDLLYLGADGYDKDITISKVGDLLERGADPNHKDSFGRTSLMSDVARRDMDVCRLLFDNGARVTRGHSSREEATCLAYAARYGHLNLCSILLGKQGANVKNNDSHIGTSMLNAAWSGDVDICNLLLSKGADVRLKRRCSWCPTFKTPLDVAASCGHEAVCRLFLENGAVITAGHPLFCAAGNGRLDVCALLLKKGAKVMTGGECGMTCLHAAVEGGHLDVACLLLKHGARVNDVDWDGRSSLHIGARENNLDVCCWFLEHGVDIDLADKGGRTALDLAKIHKHAKVIAMLQEYKDSKAAGTSQKGKRKEGAGATPVNDSTSVVPATDKIAALEAHVAAAEEELKVERRESKRAKLEYETIVKRLEQEKLSAEAKLEEERRSRDSEKSELELTVERLEKEKAAAEASLEEDSGNRDREKQELEWVKEGAAAAAASLDVLSRERYREKLALETTVERLEQEKSTAEAKYEEQCRGRNRDKRGFEEAIGAAEVESREYKKAKHDSEVKIERLEQHIVSVEASLETEASARGREKHELEAALEAAGAKLVVESKDREREKSQLEMTVARLQEEKISAQKKVERREAEIAELGVIVKRLEHEKTKGQARVTRVLRSQGVTHVKDEPYD